MGPAYALVLRRREAASKDVPVESERRGSPLKRPRLVASGGVLRLQDPFTVPLLNANGAFLEEDGMGGDFSALVALAKRRPKSVV
jgi:hypothetical protein